MLTQGSFEGLGTIFMGPLPPIPAAADLGAWFAVGGTLVSVPSAGVGAHGIAGYALYPGAQLQALIRTSLGQKYTVALELTQLVGGSAGRAVVELAVLCQVTKTDANPITALHVFESPQNHATLDGGVWTVSSAPISQA